jgi:putative ABC transport system permease protein
VALGGGLFAQSQGFADVGLGTGVVIIGLAALIVGETLVSTRTVFLATLGCIVGALIYRVVISFALNLDAIGLQAQDLNLVTTVLVIVAIALTRLRRKRVRQPVSRVETPKVVRNGNA